MIVPEPWQRWQGWEMENSPWPCDSTPRPWQRGHTFGLVPGLAPVPLHVPQRSVVGTTIGTWAPSIDWANEICVSTSRSRPGSGRGPRPRAPPPAPPPPPPPPPAPAALAPEQAGQDVAEAARVEAAEAAAPTAAGRAEAAA